MTTKADIETLRRIMWEVECAGKEMAKFRKQLTIELPTDHIVALEVFTGNRDEDYGPFKTLGGDVGYANSQFFRVEYRTEPGGIYRNGTAYGASAELWIDCPTFLRGTLKITVKDGRVHGSY